MLMDNAVPLVQCLDQFTPSFPSIEGIIPNQYHEILAPGFCRSICFFILPMQYGWTMFDIKGKKFPLCNVMAQCPQKRSRHPYCVGPCIHA